MRLSIAGLMSALAAASASVRPCASRNWRTTRPIAEADFVSIRVRPACSRLWCSALVPVVARVRFVGELMAARVTRACRRVCRLRMAQTYCVKVKSRVTIRPMPWRLLKFGLTRAHPEPRMFTRRDSLKSAYDVVIIGGGGHGLASAYYLARDHGIRNVAVLEKGYIGGGNTGRNTTIIRSNYLTPEGVQFYDESVRLWQDLSQDFDLNLFYSTRGHFTLAHTDASMRTMRWRAEVNKHFSVNSEVVDAQAVHEAIPHMDMSCGGHAPVLGALYHAPGAIARHDAVAWGYGRGADRRGVEIHQNTEVLGIETEDTGSGPRVKAVVTSRGRIETRRVLCAVGGLDAADAEDGGAAVADLHPSAAGDGVGADQAVARPDHRVRIAARVREPECAR